MKNRSKLRNKYQQKDGAWSQPELFKKKKKEMTDAERVFSFQSKLYQKAKQERGYKFYVLYDKMFLGHMLREGWEQVKANGGAPGIDGVSIADVEHQGVESYLEELGEELRKRTYRPKAVKRVKIPKANGGERPLGIPTVKDRIAQTVCKMILEPIFEADFEESSYGFRPGRGSKEAMSAIKDHLREGRTEVLDADLSGYFDTIPHEKLMKALKQRISDPRILKLVHGWLKAPVQEDDQFRGGKRNKEGTPQGGTISPLLANIYLHLLDRIVNKAEGLFHKNGIRMVRYADDFVLMGKQMTTEIKERLWELIDRMGLTLNEDKTRTVEAGRTGFEFLGYTVRYDKDTKGRNKRYWNIVPSPRSQREVREKVRSYLKTHGHCPAHEVSKGLNAILRGWLNYFENKGVSYPAMSKRKLRYYLMDRLNRYYARKSQRKCRLHGNDAFGELVQKFGLIDPTKYTLQ